MAVSYDRLQYREQHRAASADTKIGFVRYDYERDVRLTVGTTFSAIVRVL